MKKIYLRLILSCIVVLLISCGTNQKIASLGTATSSGDVIDQLDPCEEYAELNPAKRASGVGLHFQASTARNLAELNARAQLARAIQACIETSTKSYADGTTLFSTDDPSGVSATDQASKVGDREASMAKEFIKGATVVKMTRYRTKNNQYKVFVCVEYSEEVPQMAAKIAKAFNEQLSPEQKARVKFNEQNFAKEMEETFKDYKGVTTGM